MPEITPPETTLQFLDERRGESPGLTGALHKGYAIHADIVRFQNYTHNGSQKNYKNIGPDSVTSTELVCQLMEKTDGRPIRVLDIGAGACTPLVTLKQEFGEQVTTTGISAHPIGCLPVKQAQAITNHGVDLRIGNGDFWQRLVNPEERFDLILSQWGLRWFGDPLAAMERALSQLNPNGMFWASPVRLPIDTGNDEAFRLALTKHGYTDVGPPYVYQKSDAIINELLLEKSEEASMGPVFENIGYENFTISVHEISRSHRSMQKQAYYKILDEA